MTLPTTEFRMKTKPNARLNRLVTAMILSDFSTAVQSQTRTFRRLFVNLAPVFPKGKGRTRI
jgi:hypothetical protein